MALSNLTLSGQIETSVGVFIHLKFLMTILDVINSIGAVSARTEVLYPITISVHKTYAHALR